MAIYPLDKEAQQAWRMMMTMPGEHLKIGRIIDAKQDALDTLLSLQKR